MTYLPGEGPLVVQRRCCGQPGGEHKMDCSQPAPTIICNQREIESSHAGGTDYSAPCDKVVNRHLKHKGPHRNRTGHEWGAV